jgi:hypothetical protein
MGRVRTRMALVPYGWGRAVGRFKSGLPDQPEAGFEGFAAPPRVRSTPVTAANLR